MTSPRSCSSIRGADTHSLVSWSLRGAKVSAVSCSNVQSQHDLAKELPGADRLDAMLFNLVTDCPICA